MLDDSRNLLVKEFVRIVSELDSKTFVFENVKGLTIGKHRMFLEALIEAFSRSGYEVRVPWRVLNAMDYGVPQDRQRLFLLGARKGCSLPSYPAPTSRSGDDLFRSKQSRPIPTCSDALADLPNAEDFPELVDSDSTEIEERGPASEYSRELRVESQDFWYFGYERVWHPEMLTASTRTTHTDISRRRFSATREGEVEPISRFFKLKRDSVCNTLRAGTDSARGAFTSPRPIHYAFPRCVTVREMARLHGFPDWFRFNVTKWHGAREVGNSVPPPLARAVAASVATALKIIPKRPRRLIRLGNPDLLSMDMGEAAAYWKVPVPIAGRNRKSGLAKRKQSEIEANLSGVARSR